MVSSQENVKMFSLTQKCTKINFSRIPSKFGPKREIARNQILKRYCTEETFAMIEKIQESCWTFPLTEEECLMTRIIWLVAGK
jgi:hypothetical protein